MEDRVKLEGAEKEVAAMPFNEARKLLDDAWDGATKAYKAAKEQADIIYKEAKKMAVDKETKKRADEAHKEAIKAAEKIRDAITDEAQAVFSNFWTQKELSDQMAITKSKERSDLAQKTYKEAKNQADIDHKAAQGSANDKEGKKAADQARTETLKKAKEDYEETIRK
jgi:hypothetical protein